MAVDWQDELGRENASYAQFWYSPKTIDCLLQQCRRPDVNRVAMLSAPSLYFALTKTTALEEGDRDRSNPEAWLFEFDTRWESDEHFVYFDYRHGPNLIPLTHAGKYDLIIADPPNLMLTTVDMYASVIRHLARGTGAKVLFVTSSDWYGPMLGLLNALPVRFEPVMPTAAWSQCGKFRLFANYRDDALKELNPDAQTLKEECSSDGGDEDYTGYYMGLPDCDL